LVPSLSDDGDEEDEVQEESDEEEELQQESDEGGMQIRLRGRRLRGRRHIRMRERPIRMRRHMSLRRRMGSWGAGQGLCRRSISGPHSASGSTHTACEPTGY
jgi:hypothetical protein